MTLCSQDQGQRRKARIVSSSRPHRREGGALCILPGGAQSRDPPPRQSLTVHGRHPHPSTPLTATLHRRSDAARALRPCLDEPADQNPGSRDPGTQVVRGAASPPASSRRIPRICTPRRACISLHAPAAHVASSPLLPADHGAVVKGTELRSPCRSSDPHRSRRKHELVPAGLKGQLSKSYGNSLELGIT